MTSNETNPQDALAQQTTQNPAQQATTVAAPVATSAPAPVTVHVAPATVAPVAPTPVQPPTVTYVPGREDPVSVTWGKLVFEANKPRVVSDPRLLERAKRNPWFKVEGHDLAAKGFDPANDKPVNSTQYRAYAITWIRTANASAELMSRWNREEALRLDCGVGTDDLDYIDRHYAPRLEQLRKMEDAGDAR